jgi:phosphoglycolate phosphatase
MAAESPMNAAITILDILHLDERFFTLTEWFRLIHGQRKPAKYAAVDGAVQLVRELSEEYDLGIITTRNRSDTELFLEFFGLHDCFKTVVTRQDVKRLKPHPEPVRHAAEQLGYSPAQCVMVGDTTVDVQAGKRAGALTVGVLCGFGERPELERLKPDLLLETTSLLKQRLPSAVQAWCEDW